MVELVVAVSSPSIGYAYHCSALPKPVSNFERVPNYSNENSQTAFCGSTVRLWVAWMNGSRTKLLTSKWIKKHNQLPDFCQDVQLLHALVRLLSPDHIHCPSNHVKKDRVCILCTEQVWKADMQETARKLISMCWNKAGRETHWIVYIGQNSCRSTAERAVYRQSHLLLGTRRSMNLGVITAGYKPQKIS